MTTSQLAEELDDVPVASLYRHIARLLNEGVLQVVAEQRIRGAVERTYTLRSAAALLHSDELAAVTADDHTHAFMAFIAGALSDFDRYIATAPANPSNDGAGYRLAATWLSDAEYNEFLQDLVAVIQPWPTRQKATDDVACSTGSPFRTHGDRLPSRESPQPRVPFGLSPAVLLQSVLFSRTSRSSGARAGRCARS